MLNQNQTFPENIDSIISDILQKYKLKESNEECFEKFEKEEETNGGIIAGIIKRVIQEKLSSQELINLLQKELNILSEAKNLADDLKEKIFPLIVYPKKRILPPEEIESVKPKKKDIYREPVA